MKKAFKTYSQAPFGNIPPGIPLDWMWIILDIPDEQEAAFLSGGFQVLSDSEFSSYKAERQQAYDDWANAYDLNKTGQALRVMDLVREEFSEYHPSKIDFRRHLKEDVYLQKNVTMTPNGRPHIATYSYLGVMIAEIEFVFEVNAFNFMTRRKELLSYYKNDNTKSEQWLKADDIYDVNNPYHLREMMKERSNARSQIIDEVKAVLNGVLAAFYVPQGKTYHEILQIEGDFWNAYGQDINSWINVGSPSFSQSVTNDVDFDFLEAFVAPGLTVRQFILSKISY